MFDFYEKRKLRNILYSKPVLGLLVVIMFFFAYTAWGALEKELETRATWKERAAVLSELEGRETELEAEIERLKTEKGIEAEIRSKFEVAKEGEEVIVIVEPPEEENTIRLLEEKGFWARLFGL